MLRMALSIYPQGLPMYQAHAQELLNQKESVQAGFEQESPQHPLYTATKRLVGALERLESSLERVAIEPPSVQAQQQLAFFARENESLRAEREHLTNSVNLLQGQYNDLQQVATTLHAKLDDSIKRLSQLLEADA